MCVRWPAPHVREAASKDILISFVLMYSFIVLIWQQTVFSVFFKDVSKMYVLLLLLLLLMIIIIINNSSFLACTARARSCQHRRVAALGRHHQGPGGWRVYIYIYIYIHTLCVCVRLIIILIWISIINNNIGQVSPHQPNSNGRQSPVLMRAYHESYISV